MFFLVYSQSCATSTTINFRTFSSPPKEALYPSELILHFLLPHLPARQPLIYFLSLWIFLFWTFHINRTQQYEVFCDRLLSLGILFLSFIHGVACIVLRFFLLLNNIPLYGYIALYLSIHQLMDIWVVSTFWLSWIMLLWTSDYNFLCGHMFSFLLVYT